MAKDVKEMVAVRLDPADRRLLKALCRRLRVSESDFDQDGGAGFCPA